MFTRTQKNDLFPGARSRWLLGLLAISSMSAVACSALVDDELHGKSSNADANGSAGEGGEGGSAGQAGGGSGGTTMTGTGSNIAGTNTGGTADGSGATGGGGKGGGNETGGAGAGGTGTGGTGTGGTGNGGNGNGGNGNGGNGNGGNGNGGNGNGGNGNGGSGGGNGGGNGNGSSGSGAGTGGSQNMTNGTCQTASDCVYVHAASICDGGQCKIVDCDEDFGDCNEQRDDGCEVNLLQDAQHCGSCNKVCKGAHDECIDGKCK